MRERREKGKKREGLIITQACACAHTDAYDNTHTHTHTNTLTNSSRKKGREQ